MPESNIGAIIFVIFVIVVAGIFGWFLLCDRINLAVGEGAITPTKDNFLPSVTCDVSRFVGVYGNLVDSKGSTQLTYGGTSYFFASFEQSQKMLFRQDLDSCRIVEDPNEAVGIIQMYLYSDQVQGFDVNFFNKMRWCTRRAAGADRVCKITSSISNLFSNPLVNVVSYVPETVFDSVSTNLKNKEWIVVGQLVNGTKFMKKIAGSTVITVTIDVLKDTSCSLANPYQLGIFNESNEINQSYVDARKRIFYQSTIQDIELANKSIAIYAELDKKNPNLFNSIIYSVNDTLNGDKDCIGYDYGGKALSFNTDLNYIVSTAKPWVNSYLSDLLVERQSALADLNVVSTVKAKNYTWDKLIPIQKYLEYSTYKDKSKEAFDSQLYVKVGELSKEDTNFHSTFWAQVNIFDYIFGGALWIICIAIILVLGYFGVMIIIDIFG